MKPLLYVAFQLVVIGVGPGRACPARPVLRVQLAWVGAYGGVIGLDVWYLSTYAYPAGFSF